eukprot:3490559-Prymnesium_polylepis.1
MVKLHTQEGTVPHRDKPERIPWPLREYKLCIMLVCSVSLGDRPRVTSGRILELPGLAGWKRRFKGPQSEQLVNATGGCYGV